MTYKRFMVFSFPEYYPSGGLNDVRGSYDSIEEAVLDIDNETIHTSSDGWHIFDRIEGEIVQSSVE